MKAASSRHGETRGPSAGEQPEADRFGLYHKSVGREKENGGPILQKQETATFRSHEQRIRGRKSLLQVCLRSLIRREAERRAREARRKEPRNGFL